MCGRPHYNTQTKPNCVTRGFLVGGGGIVNVLLRVLVPVSELLELWLRRVKTTQPSEITVALTY
jgi:hypothetical protein